jgi:hypothetical protein
MNYYNYDCFFSISLRAHTSVEHIPPGYYGCDYITTRLLKRTDRGLLTYEACDDGTLFVFD